MSTKKPKVKKTRYFPLEMLVRRSSQSEVARRLGCSQANISRILSEGRAVYVCLNGDGTATTVELKGCISPVDRDLLHDLGNQCIAGL